MILPWQNALNAEGLTPKALVVWLSSLVGQAKLSRAVPRTRPALVAFIPTPGVDEEVSGSPALIGPFSVETLTRTRPARATGMGLSVSLIVSLPTDEKSDQFWLVTPKMLF